MSDTSTTRHDSQVVRRDRHGHILLVTINRPEARNAVNGRVADELGAALEEADSDNEIRALVVTGSGGAFCAGADLKAVGRGESLDATGHAEWGFAGYVRHFVAVPTIAAVNGFALGGGTELVLASDLAVLDPDATLGLPEVKRGLMAAAGGVVRLQRQVAPKVANEIALTGDPISARRAVEIGLANAVSEPGQVVDLAMELAGRIAANAPVSVRESKKVLHRTATLGSDWDDEPWAISNRAMGRILRTDDFREGTRAFAEKRPPVWTGR